jgi:Family of unknown function (DUF5691)
LLRAGMAAVYRAAGRKAETDVEEPVPASGETLPACSAKAAEIVRRLLVAQRTEMLREALDRLRLARLRVPHALLPAALDVQRTQLRPAVAAVLGERGPWLAAQNPNWAWAVATRGSEDDETAWEEGALGERISTLRRVRGRDQALGLAWVEDVWKSEKADARVAMVKALETGLSPGDEPFLERALDDRSVKVREAAAALLSRLPGSAYAERAAERVDGVLVYYEPATGGLKGMAAELFGGGRGRLVVDPPEDLDASWKRDLPGSGPMLWGVGESARSIARAMETTPLEHWEDRFGLEPAAIVAAIEGNDWEAAVLIGWCRAVGLHGHRSWALALWERCYRLGHEDAERQAVWDVTISTLIGCVDQDSFAKVVSSLLDDGDMPELLSHTFLALPGPWNDALSKVYFEALQEHARKVFFGRRVTTTAHWPNTLRAAAERLSPSCLDLARITLPDFPPDGQESHVKGHWRRELEKFEDTLELRRKLVEEIPL